MPDVFISYRRGDSAGHAGRLSDSLSSHFGTEHVFMDLDAISPGADFVERIRQGVGSCDAALVLIGDGWLAATDQSGNRRLDNPEDFVRLEIAEALGRPGIQVIPVLVEGAKMPDADDLPEDIQPLARRNAIELSDQRWRFDTERLKQAIEGAGPRSRLRAVGSRTRRVPVWAIVGLVALVAAAVVGVLVLGGGGKNKVAVQPGTYNGATSNGTALRFVVADGEIRDMQFSGASTCQSSQLPERQFPFQFSALPTTKGRIGSDGAFRIRVNFPEQTFRMEGSFSRTRGEGNLEFSYGADANGNGPLGGGPYRCDTGPQSWHASR